VTDPARAELAAHLLDLAAALDAAAEAMTQALDGGVPQGAAPADGGEEG
jgi:hypothetical protein